MDRLSIDASRFATNIIYTVRKCTKEEFEQWLLEHSDDELIQMLHKERIAYECNT